MGCRSACALISLLRSLNSQAALCDSLECSLPDGVDRRGSDIAGTPASTPTARHTQLAGPACRAAASEDARSACLGPQSRCRSSWPASILVSMLLIMLWFGNWTTAAHDDSVARQLRMLADRAALDSPHIMSVMHAAGVNGWGPPPRHAPGAAQQNGKADSQEEDKAAPPPPPPPLPSQSDAAAVY